MKIDRIELRDFRCYETAALDFSPLTIVRGPNHKGKSTIQMAAQLALTGITKGTDGQGRFANRKIRKGAKKAGIDITLNNGNGAQVMKVTYGPNKTGRQVASEHSDGFKRWIENHRDALNCALDSGYFIRQSVERQQAILASLVLPAEYAFPVATMELVERCGFQTSDTFWDLPPMQIIQQAYDCAFAERRLAKSGLAAIRLPALPEKPARTAQEIHTLLVAARKKVGSLSKKNKGNQRDVDIARLTGEESMVRQSLEEIRFSMESLQERIKEALKESLTVAEIGEYEAIAKNRAKYNGFQEQINVINEKIEEDLQIVALYEALKSKPQCPTCLQGISAEFIAKQILETQHRLRTRREKLGEVGELQQALGNVEQAEAALESEARHQQLIGRLQQEHGEKGGPLARAQARLNEISAQLKATRETPVVEVDTTELDEATKEVADLEAQLLPATTYEAVERQVKELSARQIEQEKVVADLEAMCAEFGKDGIQAKLIAENIATFEQAINAVLSQWGYAAVISIEPYVFEVNGLPLTELSESEEMMFGVALQTAISARAGIGTVIVDRGDVFVGAERTRLFSLLARMLKDGLLKQAIVMVSDENREYTPREGVTYYMIADGKVEKL